MSAAKKMFVSILAKMGVKAKGDEKELKKAFETALEAGKAPEELDKPQVDFLKGLGYEIEIEEPKKGKGKKDKAPKEEPPAKGKKPKPGKPTPPDEDEDEAPAKPKGERGKVKAWFQKFWAEHTTCTRKLLLKKFCAKFGESTKGTCQLYIYEACKGPKKFGFTLVKGKDDKDRNTLTLKTGKDKGTKAPKGDKGKKAGKVTKPTKISKKGKAKASDEEE